MTELTVLDAKTPSDGLPGRTQLLELFRVMLTARRLDERVAELHREGAIGFHVPARGNEAASIGAAAALESKDWIYPSWRSPGVPLLRGISVRTLVDDLVANGPATGKGRPCPGFHGYRDARIVPMTSGLGAHLPAAVGCARGAGEGRIALAAFGHAAVAGPAFAGAINLAHAWNAPIVFLCERERERDVDAPSMAAAAAQAAGLAVTAVDGNDVLAVHEACREAALAARTGGGPRFLEARTTRPGPHRPVGDGHDADPLTRFEGWLAEANLLPDDLRDEMSVAIDAELETAIEGARRAAGPLPGTLYDDVTSLDSAALRRQREARS